MRRFWLKLFRRPFLHADLEAEMAFHREMAAAHGNPVGLGNTTSVREQALDLWRFTLLEDFARDVVYAARGARRSPGFAVTALLSLALGIGANTAIFSLMDAVLLRTLPVERPHELEQVTVQNGNNNISVFSYPNFRDFRSTSAFSALFARCAIPGSLVAGGRTDRGVVEIVSGSYFPALGVRPVLGRVITGDDDLVPMGHPVTVVAYRYWREKLNADPAVVGRTIRIDDHPFTVIGVAPPAFFGTEVGTITDVWVPMMMQPAVFGGGRSSFSEVGWSWMSLFGRRAPGVSEAQAQAALDVLLRQILARDKEFRGGEIAVILKPAGAGLSRLRATFESPLTVLMAVVAIVLLIACANLANLLLARSAARRREIAVRLALGAGRGRLVRQLLTESSLLGILGGALGVAASSWAVRSLLRFLPSERLPMELDARLDWRILAFAFALSLLTGVMFGLVPALAATRRNISGAQGGVGIFSQSLVAVQVALSLLLLVGAGLFLQSLRNVAALRIGLDTDHVLMASVNPALSGYTQPQVVNFYRQLEARVREIPGVNAVGLSEAALLSGNWNGVGFQVPGQPPPPPGGGVLMNKVGGDFFQTAGIAILRGRDFGPGDTPASTLAVIINESAARHYFPGAEAYGRDVVVMGQPARIIGIAADSKYRSVREETPRIAYVSFQQERNPSRERTVYLRTAGDPTLLATALRAAIRDLDRNLPVYGMKTFAEQKAESMAGERLIATLSGFFGILALLLAAIGLYGVLAYLVERRTREIGIRMSLGAGRRRVLWTVLRGALSMTACGLIVGLPLSLWLSTIVEKQLFGIRPGDPATYAAAGLALTVVVVAAAAIPAWRASRVNPLIALRYE